ncbi:MAG TPA: hypothetical protein DCR40_20010 [Prolixibacteraceae bacterium]|nr:hypothetical protein [Prolixibacteraceae bacterium]
MKNEELDHIIEKSFRTEPGFHLSTDFAQKVVFTVVRREQWKTDLREYLYLMGVLLSLLALVSGFFYFVDKDFVLKTFAFLTSNIVPVISVVFILNFIFFADKVLLRLLFSRWSKT